MSVETYHEQLRDKALEHIQNAIESISPIVIENSEDFNKDYFHKIESALSLLIKIRASLEI